jgi:uncharacterized protein
MRKKSDRWAIPTKEEIPHLTYDDLLEHVRSARVSAAYHRVAGALSLELKSRTSAASYKCMKCGHSKFQVGEMRVSRSFLNAFLNVEGGKYKAVVCERCKFTEFYQGDVPTGQQAIDLLLGP